MGGQGLSRKVRCLAQRVGSGLPCRNARVELSAFCVRMRGVVCTGVLAPRRSRRSGLGVREDRYAAGPLPSSSSASASGRCDMARRRVVVSVPMFTYPSTDIRVELTAQCITAICTPVWMQSGHHLPRLPVRPEPVPSAVSCTYLSVSRLCSVRDSRL